MENARLDDEFRRIFNNFSYLWETYRFRVKYFTRDYGIYNRGLIIGLENNLCKLVFEKESNSPVEPITEYVGRKSSQFIPPGYSYWPKYGWYPVTGLVNWLSGVQCERDNNVDKDLEFVGQFLKIHMDKVLDLFRIPEEFDKKLEYYRNLTKENLITVERIKEERARLNALGRDSSLEAAIASLRGGRK